MRKAPLDVATLVDVLESDYGPPPPIPRFSPMDELVSCILSQHTSDANSLPAFFRLKEELPSWDAVVEAGESRVAKVIRNAGLANQKAKSIIGTLCAIRERTGAYDISHLSDLGTAEALDWLVGLPGVGPKTASIVLCFSFGRDCVPVDTHVYRVGKRLDLIPGEMSADAAHAELRQRVPPGLAYRFHMALIRHGRSVCRAPKPRCEGCRLREQCPGAELAPVVRTS